MESTSGAHEMGLVIGGILACFLSVAVPTVFIFTLIMALTRKSKGWIVGAVVTGLLSLLLLGSAIFFGARAAVEQTKEAKVARVFTATDGLTSVSGAPGWRGLDLDVAAATLRIGNGFAEEYLIVISEPKSGFETGFEVVDYAEIGAQQIMDAVEEGLVSDLVETTIQGRRAYQCEVSGSIDGIEISYLNTYVDGVAHFHQILSWTLTTNKEKSFPRLRKAATTFKEIEVPAR